MEHSESKHINSDLVSILGKRFSQDSQHRNLMPQNQVSLRTLMGRVLVFGMLSGDNLSEFLVIV